MVLDIARIRADFPALKSGVAFFDSPGGTQTPRQVSEAISTAMQRPLSNRGSRTAAERNADAIVGAHVPPWPTCCAQMRAG